MPEKNVQVNTDRGLPYERFLQFGPENLTEAELLAVILRTGTKEDSAVALAEKVLALATYPREGSPSVLPHSHHADPPIREKDCWVCMM